VRIARINIKTTVMPAAADQHPAPSAVGQEAVIIGDPFLNYFALGLPLFS